MTSVAYDSTIDFLRLPLLLRNNRKTLLERPHGILSATLSVNLWENIYPLFMPHKTSQNFCCKYVVIVFGKSQWQSLSFHNSTMHTLFNSPHLHITSYVNSWKNGQRSALPSQAINEASVLVLHNVARNIIGYVAI